MRMLFVHNFHQKFGGDDTVVLNYVKMLRERGHDVELYQRHNDEISSLGVVGKIRFFMDAVFSVRTWQDIKGLIQQYKPDIIMVHGIYPLISPSVFDVAWKYNIPVVQMVHDMRFWCPSAWFFRQGKVCTLCAEGNFLHAIFYRCYRGSFLLSGLYATSIALVRMRGYFKKIRLFIIPSTHIEQYLLDSDVSPDRIAFHPHIIPFDDGSSEMPDSEHRYIAYLGRLSPEKGVMLIMKAAQSLPHITFKIGGTGPMEIELQEYAKQHHLKNVEFCGFLKGEEKNKFLQKASILLAPSDCYESFGQVVVEAYVATTPVIAANHGGLASLVKDGETGWLFPPGNLERFVEVVDKAWVYPHLDEISRNALDYYKNELAKDKLIVDLEYSLESVVK